MCEQGVPSAPLQFFFFQVPTNETAMFHKVSHLQPMEPSSSDVSTTHSQKQQCLVLGRTTIWCC